MSETMTAEQAVSKLTNIMHDDHYSWSPAILTAFNMAVDALKGAEGDCISRERLKESLLSEGYETHDYCFPCKEIMKRIDEQPSAQPTHNNTSNALKSLDCIDRQAALDALKRAEALTRAFGYHYVIDTIQELPSAQPLVIHCTDCEDWLERQSISGFAISELPPAQPEQRWIPVTERLPDTDNEVLVTVLDMEDDYVEVYKGFYQDHEWWTQWCHGCLRIKDEPCGANIVTAWMPLPEPWKEGDTE